MAQKRKKTMNQTGFREFLKKRKNFAESTINNYCKYIRNDYSVSQIQTYKILNKGRQAYFALKAYAEYDPRFAKWIPSKPPKSKPLPIPKRISRDEIQKLFEYLKAVDKELYFFLWFINHTGIRPGTCCKLSKKSFEGKGNPLQEGEDTTAFVIVTKGDYQIRKKITRNLYVQLMDFAKNKKPDALIFDKDEDSVYRRRLHRYAEQVFPERYHGYPREPITPHMFRHSFAIRLYDRVKDIKMVQMALNHKNIGTTMRYLEGREDTSSQEVIAMQQEAQQ